MKTLYKRKTNVCKKKIYQIESDQQSEVHEILFIKADRTLQYYIGMTNRNFEMTMIEYAIYVKYNKKTDALTSQRKKGLLKTNFKIAK